MLTISLRHYFCTRNHEHAGDAYTWLFRSVTTVLTGWALVMGAQVAVAAQHDARKQLNTFVTTVASASGSFTQATETSRGSAAPDQSGTFAFQRPGRFKWEVKQPYEQLVVSDGQQLFQYDPDLAQVSVRPVDEAIGNAPAAVLFGDGSLDASFELEPLPGRDNLQWLRATPRSAEAGFAHMDIGLANNLPQRIEILDAFGQTTTVEFTTLVPNPQLSADVFRFDPPPGVDVVNMR